MLKNIMLIFAVCLLQLFFITGQTLAHRVNVFAWLDNDDIIVESDFGKNKPAVNALVSVVDAASKKELLSGRTGPSGRFIFKVPEVVRQGHGLIIDVNAGQGHRNEWKMDASELYAAASLTVGFDQARLESAAEQSAAPETRPETAAQTGSANSAVPAAKRDSAVIQAAIAQANESSQAMGRNSDESLKAIEDLKKSFDAQLGSIRQELAQQRQKGASFTEILGGIGWIIGLVGVALYFMSKRK